MNDLLPAQAARYRRLVERVAGVLSRYGYSELRTPVLERTELFACAESLGGVESLANHPAVMTHASVPEERRAKLGVTDNLVRLSVGIEDLADLRAEIEVALR